MNPQYNTHLLRLDWEVTDAAAGAVLEELTRRAVAAVPDADVVIFSDYLKGVLQPSLMAAVATAAARSGTPVIVDPKGRDFARYRGATVIAPNLHEISLALGHNVPQEDAAVEQAAGEISALSGIAAVVVKRSQSGVQLVENGRTAARFPTLARRVTDVSGAGDTLVAALAMALAAGADLEAATRIANAAAGVAVAKKGTAAATAEELAELVLHRHEHRISPKIYANEQALQQQVLRWQDEGFSVGFTNGCFDLLHPGHIFTLTESRNRVDRLVLAPRNEIGEVRRGAARRVSSREALPRSMAEAL